MRVVAAVCGVGFVAAACGASVAPSEGSAAPLTLVTLNLANGAGDAYRSPEARARQAEFVGRAGADVAAFQEVDLDVQRSGRVDVARAVAALDCSPSEPPFSSDGLRRCDGAAGRVLYGRAFQGDDPFDAASGVPSGIVDDDTTRDGTSADRSAAAAFGNAMLVRGGAFQRAYVVGLPTTPDQAADDPLFASLGPEASTESARPALGARNERLRRERAVEPRSVLVARIGRRAARPLSLLVTHLEAGVEHAALRARQLEAIAAVARAERAGPPQRDVVLLGDLNVTAIEARPLLAAARLVLASPAAEGFGGYDQIWVDASLTIERADAISAAGVSDHPFAMRAVVR